MRSTMLTVLGLLVVLLLASMQPATAQESAAEAAEQAEPDSDEAEEIDRASRPGSVASRTRRRVDTVTPRVDSSQPLGYLPLKIGQEYRSATLKGRNFGRIKSAFVADRRGRAVRGFRTRIGRRGRSDTNLPLGIMAGPEVSAGTYYLTLRYEVPVDRTQVHNAPPSSKPRITRPEQKTFRVPMDRLQIRAAKMNPAISALSSDPIPHNELMRLKVTFDDMPGRQVSLVRRFNGSPGSNQNCAFRPWKSVRKIVVCGENGADERVTSTTRSDDEESRGDPGAGPKTIVGDSELASASVEVDDGGEVSAGQVDPDDGDASGDERLIGMQFDFRREANACYEKVPETYTSKWLAPNKLQVEMTTGKFWFEGGCRLRFRVDTRNSAGQTFSHYIDKNVRVVR